MNLVSLDAGDMGKILGLVNTNNLTELNNLVYAGAVVRMGKMGVKRMGKDRMEKATWWKRRLEGKIRDL